SRPMLWNIWLSILPILILGVAISAGLGTLIISRPLGYIVLVVCGIIWLLMLPNASYLITELNLSHRRPDDRVPMWFDVILVITLAMSGVINTVINLFTAHTLSALYFYGDYATSYTQTPVLVVLAVVLLLVSFGMYLGRYLRFNSWDIRHPVSFAKRLREHFGDRDNRLAGLGLTITLRDLSGDDLPSHSRSTDPRHGEIRVVRLTPGPRTDHHGSHARAAGIGSRGKLPGPRSFPVTRKEPSGPQEGDLLLHVHRQATTFRNHFPRSRTSDPELTYRLEYLPSGKSRNDSTTGHRNERSRR
ncbi:DUF1361 domain-containing protein, partial [Brooklawnia sp.]|uniref:DUF1361 domain-containing protein n=1 Tax=Brooklawnia sp. TaxID=2699740 RepID=UPI00311E1FFF